MRLLVTGVSGLLGLNLALQAEGRFEVVGVMRGERAVPVAGKTPFQTIQADLTRPGEADRIVAQTHPDIIFHCAAMTEVDRCETFPEEAYLMNTLVARSLAEAADRNGAHLLHVSTDAVFDGKRGNYSESDEPNPVNVYGRTKLAAERAVAAANPDALIVRVNFYGWSWQGNRSLSEFFLNNLFAGRPIHGFTDLIFCPLLVNDMVEILLTMLDRQMTGLYHVVSSECLSKFAFGRMLAHQFGLNPDLISPASFRTGLLKARRSQQLTLSSEKLVSALGAALPTQEQAVRRYYELYCQGYPQTLRSMFVEPDHA